ncbi:MAG: hypothetical protein IKC80_05355, partial [Kiritimatiellae bacterium]|nr:hypothetical protein [Kiritimatiellia bacterium]
IAITKDGSLFFHSLSPPHPLILSLSSPSADAKIRQFSVLKKIQLLSPRFSAPLNSLSLSAATNTRFSSE